MAKATKVIHKMKIDPEVKHEQELRELENLLLEHKDTLHDMFDIADKLKDREILNMISSALGQSDRVIHRIVTAIDESETPQSMKNMLLLFQLLGTIDMEQIEPIVLKINSGIARAAEYEHEKKPAGYTGLLGALKDPHVIEGLNVLVKIVKGMGEGKEDEERVEPQKDRLENPEKEMNEEPKDNQEKRSSASRKKRAASSSRPAAKWYALAAGAGALAIPLLMKGQKVKNNSPVE
ncbi:MULTISPECIES: DUF1641 domain-containing protein [Salinicoccus]|uniref:DUF1641 domain-containing protein n=1 Tax=Salinicoccus TaxID=45669 RepID=UPI0004E1ECF9|nr:DUF1641 domain-containing protein [Salinicoccus luteus]